MSSNILVVIPTYNEALNVVRLVDSILREETAEYCLDVLVVDDSSPDGTSALVERHPSFGKKVFLIKRSKKDGRGGAVLAGFKYAMEKSNYDFVVEMDSDFSHDPKELPLLIRQGLTHDLTIASRYARGSKIIGWSWKRKIFSRLANIYARSILRMPLSDYTNGYRCYSIALLKLLDFSLIRSRGYIVLSDIAYQLFLNGAKISCIPTVFVNRTRGGSNFSISEVKEALFAVPRIYRNYSHLRRKSIYAN